VTVMTLACMNVHCAKDTGTPAPPAPKHTNAHIHTYNTHAHEQEALRELRDLSWAGRLKMLHNVAAAMM
jgi:hypothetical protein